MAANPPQTGGTVAKPSAQSLLLQTSFNGVGSGIGTGFVVETPRGPALITNRHVVTGRDQATNLPLSPTGGIPNELAIWHNGVARLGEWHLRLEPLLDHDIPRWIEHPTLAARADFVALPRTQLEQVQLFPHDTAVSANPLILAPGEIVSVVGFPLGLTAGGSFAIWATGFIASDPDINFQNLPVFLIDCRSRQGQSGSPVIAHRTGAVNTQSGLMMGGGPTIQVLGVYSGRVNRESDLGFVWKTSAIRELIESIR